MDYYSIMSVLVVAGALLAFDIGELQAGSGTTIQCPSLGGWTRRRLPNPARAVGWIFFIPGMMTVALTIVAGIIHIVKLRFGWRLARTSKLGMKARTVRLGSDEAQAVVLGVVCEVLRVEGCQGPGRWLGSRRRSNCR